MRTPIHLFKCKSPKLAKAVKKIAKELRQVHGRKHGLLMHVYQHRERKDIHAYLLHTETEIPDNDLIHRFGLDRVMIRPLYQPKMPKGE